MYIFFSIVFVTAKKGIILTTDMSEKFACKEPLRLLTMVDEFNNGDVPSDEVREKNIFVSCDHSESDKQA